MPVGGLGDGGGGEGDGEVEGEGDGEGDDAEKVQLAIESAPPQAEHAHEHSCLSMPPGYSGASASHVGVAVHEAPHQASHFAWKAPHASRSTEQLSSSVGPQPAAGPPLHSGVAPQ